MPSSYSDSVQIQMFTVCTTYSQTLLLERWNPKRRNSVDLDSARICPSQGLLGPSAQNSKFGFQPEGQLLTEPQRATGSLGAVEINWDQPWQLADSVLRLGAIYNWRTWTYVGWKNLQSIIQQIQSQKSTYSSKGCNQYFHQLEKAVTVSLY